MLVWNECSVIGENADRKRFGLMLDKPVWENVTAVTMSDDAILHPAWAEPRSNADGLVAHELAHSAARAGVIELAPNPHDKRILQALRFDERGGHRGGGDDRQ